MQEDNIQNKKTTLENNEKKITETIETNLNKIQIW